MHLSHCHLHPCALLSQPAAPVSFSHCDYLHCGPSYHHPFLCPLAVTISIVPLSYHHPRPMSSHYHLISALLPSSLPPSPVPFSHCHHLSCALLSQPPSPVTFSHCHHLPMPFFHCHSLLCPLSLPPSSPCLSPHYILLHLFLSFTVSCHSFPCKIFPHAPTPPVLGSHLSPIIASHLLSPYQHTSHTCWAK